MSHDEPETSITFKCPRYLKDALNLNANRNGLPLSPFLRMCTENELLKEMVMESRKRFGFVVTVKKLQSEITLDEWDEAKSMLKGTPTVQVLPEIQR